MCLLCNHCAILHTGPDHLWILVSGSGAGIILIDSGICASSKMCGWSGSVVHGIQTVNAQHVFLQFCPYSSHGMLSLTSAEAEPWLQSGCDAHR